MLKERADVRTLAFIAWFFILIGIGYSLPFGWTTTPVLTVLIALQSFFCAVITHNTIHAPMFANKGMNRVIQVLLTLAYGHPVSMYVPGHNLSHHRFTQTRKDVIRTTKLRFRWNLLNQLCFTWVVGPSVFKSNLVYAKAMRHERPGWYRQLWIEIIFFVGFLGLLLVLDWQKFFFYVLIPHQYAAWGIMGINFAQHDGADGTSEFNHSRNFTGRLVNWFTFNNGYHGIHHMYPSLHWSKAPAVHAEKLHPFVHPALEQKNFLTYIIEAYVWPGKRMTYDGKPFVPEAAGEDEAWFKPAETFDPADLGAVTQ
ncbi:MAG: fatty acid desaturase [Myxococcota bacterium]